MRRQGSADVPLFKADCNFGERTAFPNSYQLLHVDIIGTL